jgi:hypothetical protein
LFSLHQSVGVVCLLSLTFQLTLQASEQEVESELAILGLGSGRGGVGPGGTLVGDTWRLRCVGDRQGRDNSGGGAQGTHHWLAAEPTNMRVGVLGQSTRREMGGFRLRCHLQHGVDSLLTVCQAGPEKLRGCLASTEFVQGVGDGGARYRRYFAWAEDIF